MAQQFENPEQQNPLPSRSSFGPASPAATPGSPGFGNIHINLGAAGPAPLSVPANQGTLLSPQSQHHAEHLADAAGDIHGNVLRKALQELEEVDDYATFINNRLRQLESDHLLLPGERLIVEETLTIIVSEDEADRKAKLVRRQRRELIDRPQPSPLARTIMGVAADSMTTAADQTNTNGRERVASAEEYPPKSEHERRVRRQCESRSVLQDVAGAISGASLGAAIGGPAGVVFGAVIGGLIGGSSSSLAAILGDERYVPPRRGKRR